MGDVVSLKLIRKRKARAAKEDQAAENRAKFGRSGDERKLTEALKEKAGRNLDGHKLDE
jgi:hypothetical protein